MTLSVDEALVLHYIQDVANMYYARSNDGWWDILSDFISQKLEEDLDD